MHRTGFHRTLRHHSQGRAGISAADAWWRARPGPVDVSVAARRAFQAGGASRNSRVADLCASCGSNRWQAGAAIEAIDSRLCSPQCRSTRRSTAGAFPTRRARRSAVSGPGLVELTGTGFPLTNLSQCARAVRAAECGRSHGPERRLRLRLKWTPDQLPPRPGMPADQPFRMNGVEIDPNGPSIFTAVQEQLGLKLDAQRGPSKCSSSITSSGRRRTDLWNLCNGASNHLHDCQTHSRAPRVRGRSDLAVRPRSRSRAGACRTTGRSSRLRRSGRTPPMTERS